MYDVEIPQKIAIKIKYYLNQNVMNSRYLIRAFLYIF